MTRQGRGRPASHRGPQGAVGPHGRPPYKPERGGAACRHQPGPSVPDLDSQRTPSRDVLRRLHDVLFAPSPAELVAPVELKVMAWKKGGRNGVVVEGPAGRERTLSVRRPGTLGRRGRVRLYLRLRQPGPRVGEPPGGRAGLRRDAQQAGNGGHTGHRTLGLLTARLKPCGGLIRRRGERLPLASSHPCPEDRRIRTPQTLDAL